MKKIKLNIHRYLIEWYQNNIKKPFFLDFFMYIIFIFGYIGPIISNLRLADHGVHFVVICFIWLCFGFVLTVFHAGQRFNWTPLGTKIKKVSDEFKEEKNVNGDENSGNGKFSLYHLNYVWVLNHLYTPWYLKQENTLAAIAVMATLAFGGLSLIVDDKFAEFEILQDDIEQRKSTVEKLNEKITKLNDDTSNKNQTLDDTTKKLKNAQLNLTNIIQDVNQGLDSLLNPLIHLYNLEMTDLNHNTSTGYLIGTILKMESKFRNAEHSKLNNLLISTDDHRMFCDTNSLSNAQNILENINKCDEQVVNSTNTVTTIFRKTVLIQLLESLTDGRILEENYVSKNVTNAIHELKKINTKFKDVSNNDGVLFGDNDVPSVNFTYTFLSYEIINFGKILAVLHPLKFIDSEILENRAGEINELCREAGFWCSFSLYYTPPDRWKNYNGFGTIYSHFENSFGINVSRKIQMLFSVLKDVDGVCEGALNNFISGAEDGKRFVKKHCEVRSDTATDSIKTFNKFLESAQ